MLETNEKSHEMVPKFKLFMLFFIKIPVLKFSILVNVWFLNGAKNAPVISACIVESFLKSFNKITLTSAPFVLKTKVESVSFLIEL